MTVLSTTQLQLDFEAGISDTHKRLKDFLRDRVHCRPGGFIPKALAAEMDLSPSELTRKLADNPRDPRNFTVDDLESYLDVTGDCEPLYYLVEKWIGRNPRASQQKITALEAEIQRLRHGAIRVSR